ncbi:bifunctional helix-turn-helix transcriptional regulator/GNAT family N-acetyltransferase [Pontivivens ytuae]|uniref:MarR family transcriptional regulator n=1 Tax=Pontivivens ytuae TaxID=2789856 RepID=A0A7S9QD90_9RHOB|nr:bifunctional helix-turn-helix transcriptional regulator/GNAT family N-acetyltransferase [Pontivivens ytuae]QPH55038.1 MarR family transcriptional regulator [Pontivivens ytuae]
MLDTIDTIRAFNRSWTRRIGLLEESLARSGYSLPEMRVLYEVGAMGGPQAAQIGAALGLDSAYLTRIVARLKADGLVETRPDPADGRARLLSMTAAGEAAMDGFIAVQRAAMEEVLEPLSPAARTALADHLAGVDALLAPAGQVALRPPELGDLGWIVERHGTVQAAELGWGSRFEALVAQIVGDFGSGHDPERERLWIAHDGPRRLGCVFCVQTDDPELAKLRLLYVDPEARGRGVGGMLLDECLRFARAAGYTRITLWTQPELDAARRLYAARGFELVESFPHAEFGIPLMGERWVRSLN